MQIAHPNRRVDAEACVRADADGCAHADRRRTESLLSTLLRAKGFLQHFQCKVLAACQQLSTAVAIGPC